MANLSPASGSVSSDDDTKHFCNVCADTATGHRLEDLIFNPRVKSILI